MHARWHNFGSGLSSGGRHPATASCHPDAACRLTSGCCLLQDGYEPDLIHFYELYDHASLLNAHNTSDKFRQYVEKVRTEKLVDQGCWERGRGGGGGGRIRRTVAS